MAMMFKLFHSRDSAAVSAFPRIGARRYNDFSPAGTLAGMTGLMGEDAHDPISTLVLLTGLPQRPDNLEF